VSIQVWSSQSCGHLVVAYLLLSSPLRCLRWRIASSLSMKRQVPIRLIPVPGCRPSLLQHIWNLRYFSCLLRLPLRISWVYHLARRLSNPRLRQFLSCLLGGPRRPAYFWKALTKLPYRSDMWAIAG